MTTTYRALFFIVLLTNASTAAENPLQFRWERGDNGHAYLRGVTRGEPFHKQGLIRLVANPKGTEVYGLFHGVAEIKRLDPETLNEKGAIPTPANPVALWCTKKHLVVACDQSRMILWISMETRKTERVVMLPTHPSLMPFEICGVAPSKALMTLWRVPALEGEKAVPGKPDSPRLEPVALVEITDQEPPLLTYHSGMGTQISGRTLGGGPTSCLEQTKAFSWCQYTHGGKNIFRQQYVEYPSDWGKIGNRVGLNRNTLIGFREGNTVRVDSNRLFSSTAYRMTGRPVRSSKDGKYLIFPRSKMAGKRALDWTYVVSQDLVKTEVEFPGLFVAEDEGSDQYVSWGRLKDWNKPEIIFARRKDGKVVRRLTIKPYKFNYTHGFVFGLCPPRTTYVPVCEILYDLCVPGKGRGLRYRCGPVDASMARPEKAPSPKK